MNKHTKKAYSDLYTNGPSYRIDCAYFERDNASFGVLMLFH